MKKRIIVIDDNPDIRHALCAILEKSGYDVAPAVGGREGVEL